MSLAAVAARRLLLRRGAGALAALFIATPRVDTGPASVGGLGASYGPSPALNSPEDGAEKQRRSIAKPFCLERDRYWRRKNIRYQAWHNQDADLMVLRSTSQSWRATKMVDRLNSEASIMDTLEQRLAAIWEEPLAKVQQLAAQWLKGIL